MDHAGETSGPAALFLRITRPRTRPLSPELRHTGAPRFFRPVTGPDTPDPDAVACKFAGILSVSGHQVPKYSSTQAPKYSSTRVLGHFRYLIIQIFEYSDTQVFKYLSIQIFLFK